MTVAHPRRHTILLLLLAVLLCIAAYAPGLSGPWIFDDYTNIIGNNYIRIQNLDISSLYHAAFSFESGPLRRPISMLSFALNYQLVGGLGNTISFKLTNLVIHLVNTLLVFWLAALTFLCLRKIPDTETRYVIPSDGTAWMLGACVALVWSVHPIQLTSVLYVVQRMTELAATFTLLGLISYLCGRRIKTDKKIRKFLLMILGPVVFGLLGIFSKENAVLLPLFIAVFELILFRGEWPWRDWMKIPVQQKRLISILIGSLLLAALLTVILYALPRYESRNFTMLERLFSESRVLFFYLSLLVVPDISRFGHLHDDIAVSSSIFVPWTTLPSILGILALVSAGFYFRRVKPLLGLALLWYFTGHLIESTIYPLEIAHEHRNYLPSFGFALGVTSLLVDVKLLAALRSRLIWLAFAIIVIALTAVTFIRATQWANYNSFFHYEVSHHPDSARIQSGYGSLLYVQKRFPEAEAAARKAANLAPYEAAHVIDLLLMGAQQQRAPDPAIHAEVVSRLTNGKISATTVITLDQVNECLQTSCKSLTPLMEQWLETILKRPNAPDPGYFQYQLGRIKAIQGQYGDALNLFQRAYETDRQFLHPLFEQINIFLKLGQIANAEFVLAELKQANAHSRYPRDREIAQVEAEIDRLKQEKEPNLYSPSSPRQ